MRRVCGIAFDCAACTDRLIGIVRYGISICLPYRKKRNRTALLRRQTPDSVAQPWNVQPVRLNPFAVSAFSVS